MRSAALLALTVGFLVSPGSASAQVRSPTVGTWDHKTISWQLAAPGCSFIEVVHSQYTILPRGNGATQGGYLRMLARMWSAIPAQGCQLPGAEGRPYLLRADSFSLEGLPGSDGTQRLVLTATSCVGNCQVGPDPAPQTLHVVSRNGETLVERTTDGGATSVRILRQVQERIANEGESERAFRPLYQPLLDGACHRFYELSLDPSTSAAIDQSTFCGFAQQMASLTPAVIHDMPSYSLGPSAARLNGMLRQHLLVDGDVIVQRHFVVDQGGATVPVTLVLRRQPDNSWRILDFVPSEP